MKKTLSLLAIMIILAANVSAYDFKVDGICYDICNDGKSVAVVGDNYESLKGDLIIPNSVKHKGKTYEVKKIESEAFIDCHDLTSVVIPNSVTEIGMGAFSLCRGLTSVTISNSVTEISVEVFKGCAELAKVDIPDSVTEIMEGAFEDCTGLTSLIIPNSVIMIHGGAFGGCTGLESIVIPNSVIDIDYFAFEDCSSLSSVTIPNSVNRIGSNAFSGCSGLTSIKSEIRDPQNVIYGDDLARANVDSKASIFEGVDKDICKVTVPSGSLKLYKSTFPWYTFKNLTESGEKDEQVHEKIGDCYYLQNDYNKTVESYKSAGAIDDKGNEMYINSLQAAQVHEKTGRRYYAKHDLDSAMVYYEVAVNRYGENSIESAALLKEIGDYYLFDKDDFNSAYIRYTKALRIYMCDAEDVHNTDIASIYYSLGQYFYSKHDVDSALDNFLKAIDLCRKDPYQHNLIEQLNLCVGLCYIQKGDNVLGYDYLKETLDLDYKTIISLFSFLDTKDRAVFWNSRSVLYQDIYPAAVLRVDEQKTINLYEGDMLGDLYDKSALFAKGLLLTSEREIKRIIQNSNNPNLIDKYNESINIGSNATELELLAASKEYGDFMQNLQLKWEQVRDTIGTNDIAIEFLSFPKFGSDSIMYIALTVRPGYPQPHFTVLCEEKELDAERAYTSTAMSEKIWKPLATELKGVKNIYFSPSGELHKIAIESMPHWEKPDVLMCDSACFNLYRLSSTRELAMKRSNVEDDGTVLYGGIRYTCTIEDMAAAPKRGRHEAENEIATIADDESKKSAKRGAERYDTKAAGLRDDTTLDFLMESRFEVDSIEKVLGTNVEKITGCDATETSFKALSGEKKKNIHIATHGYYWNDSTAQVISREHQLRPLQQGADSQQEDKAMSLSGLFFGGAQINFSEDRKELPDTINDGVLTALEVSRLDLRGLDLVVLSACKTGLGDIVGSEGVFGLQRGFKKAGAQSIVMSLWPVHDVATKDFMVKFYEGLFDSAHPLTVHQAFLEAQQYVKSKDSKYDYDPDAGLSPTRPHWAAFILLDAVR